MTGGVSPADLYEVHPQGSFVMIPSIWLIKVARTAIGVADRERRSWWWLQSLSWWFPDPGMRGGIGIGGMKGWGFRRVVKYRRREMGLGIREVWRGSGM